MTVKRPHKYHAQRTEVDGIVFHSKREAARYRELKLLEKAGEIHHLKTQHKLKLVVLAKDAPAEFPMQLIGHYIADFVYCACDQTHCDESRGVVEDVKGYDTPLSAWKRRHVKAQYGIDVRIVK